MKKEEFERKILDEHLIHLKNKPNATVWQKVLKFIFITCSSILWITDLICFHFWFRAANHLGWLPTYDNPDPKELVGFGEHYKIVGVAIEIMIVTFLIWFISFILSIATTDINNRIIVLGLLGALLSLYLILGDFFEWYID